MEIAQSIADRINFFEKEFSLCAVINDREEYATMKQSFEAKGFTDNCEYFFADNSQKNEFDAYAAISHFLKLCRGRYIILVHQDVRCIDTIDVLRERLKELDKLDEKWGLCGNAGSWDYRKNAIYLKQPGKDRYDEGLPKKVQTLDENFIIVNNRYTIAISADISGFHLYGTDMCNIAHVLGLSSWVIRFLVEHLSRGNVKALEEFKPEFIEKYGKKFQVGYVETTCTKFYLSNSPFKNRLMNKPFPFFLYKQTKRLPYLVSLLFKKKNNG